MGKITAVSPFAPDSLPRLEPLDGVRFATAEAGIRYQGRTDLLAAWHMAKQINAKPGVPRGKKKPVPTPHSRWLEDTLRS